MQNARKRGSRNPRNISVAVRDKRNVSNRGTGTTERNSSSKRLLSKLSPKGRTNLQKCQDFMIENSKFITAEEFAGKGIAVEILDVEKDVKTKIGKCIQFKVYDFKTKRERIWNTNSKRAIKAIMPLLARNIAKMLIWKKGRGMDTQYYAKPLGAAGASVGGGARRRTSASTSTFISNKHKKHRHQLMKKHRAKK